LEDFEKNKFNDHVHTNKCPKHCNTHSSERNYQQQLL